jgi:restriction system protein
MFELIVSLAQFFVVIWPVLLLIVVFMMVYGPGGLRGFLKRSRHSLFVTWWLLLAFWAVALFGQEPIPGLMPEPANSILFFGGLLFISTLEAYPVLRHYVSGQRKREQIRAIADLKKLDPGYFEEVVAVTYRALGFWVRRVGKAGDHGVDLEMRSSNGKRWIVQCKRYRDSVGEATIRELYGTLIHEKAHRAVLVTSAEITPPAEKWAHGKPIDLVDGHALLKLMEKARRRSGGTLIQKLIQKVADWWKPQPKALPQCPSCQAPMYRRPVRLIDNPGWELYRCSRYPLCRVVLEEKTLRSAKHTPPARTLYNS